MFGCIPDESAKQAEDLVRRPFEMLVGAPTMLASSDLSSYLDEVLNQSGQDCVAHWFSSAFYIAHQGKMPRISRRWAYDVARYMKTPGVLVDAGSIARLMCLGSERHGIVFESRCPYEPSKIDEPPPFDLDIAGADALFTGYYRASGDIPSLFRAAIAKGHCPGLAMRVYENFAQKGRDGSVYDDVAGSFLGNHMVTICGFRPGAFRLLNSWGTSWAEDGFCWISDRFIGSHYCFDHMIATSAPLTKG